MSTKTLSVCYRPHRSRVCAVSVMAEKLVSPWTFVGVGLLGIAIGTAIILSVTGVLPVQGRLQPGVTNWIVICAGVVFASIGCVFALTGFSGTKIGSRVRARAPGSVSSAQFFGCGGGAQFSRYDRELCRIRARTTRLQLHASVRRGDIGRRTDRPHFLRRDSAPLVGRNCRVSVVWGEGCGGERVGRLWHLADVWRTANNFRSLKQIGL